MFGIGKGVYFAVIIGFVAFGLYFYPFSLSVYSNLKDNRRLMFLAEWYDSTAGSVKKFQLTYFTIDASIELFDLKTKKLFLKRINVEDVEEKDLYIGNIINVLSRQIKVVDYADEQTKKDVTSNRQSTFAMIKPDAVKNIGHILTLIHQRGFQVGQLKMAHFSREEAENFYKEHHGRSFFSDLITYMTSGPVVGLELLKSGAVAEWRNTLGPTDSEVARTEVPESVRAKYGVDKTQNAAHGSDSEFSAERELSIFFPASGHNDGFSPKTASRLDGSTTCCVIKPHAITKGLGGQIVNDIELAKFSIVAMQMVRLNRPQAEEFLEVYKGVVNEYPKLLQHLTSGPLIAMEISSEEGETHSRFREYVGPMDPDVARELRPDTLRARFGEDKVKNAVHCSDLPEDGPLEVEYFFKVLQ